MIAVFLGFFSVIQSTLNRNLGLSNGLSTALLLTNVVAALLSALFWIFVRYCAGDDMSWLKGTLSFAELKAWHLLPGVFGFLIVLGLPFAIQQVGATRVFVGFVAAQILGSMLWDFFISHMPLVPTRVGGALLALAGAFLVSFR